MYKNLKLLRDMRNMNQKEFAASLAISYTAYNGYETGARDPKSDFWIAVAEKYGVSIDWLMGFEPAAGSKKAPSLSDEAMKIAKDYSSLDRWGRTAVRELVSTEKQRCEDETRFMEDTQLVTFEPKVINRYLEPSAAGIAAPVEGKDFEPYELGPDDPQGAAYAIRVQGDSMEPDFPDGSTVFVNHDAIVNGDIGVFCVDGGTVIKQYYRDPFGMTYLFSLNRKRADADVPVYPSSGETVNCQRRVITTRRHQLTR